MKKFGTMCLMLILTGLCLTLQAQDNKMPPPSWIRMMEDTNTNYFEARKAFDLYWKDREKPQSEKEQFAKAGKEQEGSNTKHIPYGFEYRKFKNWEIHVKPYVQDDGHILFPYQRLQLSREARRTTPLTKDK